jgi:alkanesulfonate monooxygenase SsuD/methylene tetrahydromethanopterin reductase-like flavin-dependent oxidoreductase (luciferase family)
MVAAIASDIRTRAQAFGRDPADIVIYAGLAVVAAATDAEAREKMAGYRRHASVEATLTLLSGYLGIDLSKFDPDASLEYVQVNAIQTYMEGFTKADPSRSWTLREAATHMTGGGYAPTIAGSPVTVADELTRWMEETGVDGFNIKYVVSPGDFESFVDLVVPELQNREIYKTRYEEGTFREKLFGAGHNRLPASHPGAGHRFGGGKFEAVASVERSRQQGVTL